MCCADSVSLLLNLRLGIVTCPRTSKFVTTAKLLSIVRLLLFASRETCIVVVRLHTVLYRCYRTSLSYAIHTRYTNFTASIIFPSAEGDLFPACLLLQRLLPVLDVVSNDLSSLVGGEVAADGLNEVALGVYT